MQDSNHHAAPVAVDQKNARRRAVSAALAAMSIAAALGFTLAEPAVEAKPSTYVQAAALSGQIESYLKKLQDATANAAEYKQEQIDQVRQTSAALAAVATVLALHDEDAPHKTHAAKIAAAAKKVRDKSKDAGEAAAAVADLQKAVAGEGEAAEAKWEKLGGLGAMMHHVGALDAVLSRGVEEKRFKRLAPQVAANSAVVAAVAQMSIFDTHEVKDDGKIPQWQALCIEMRDSAGALARAASGGEQAAAATEYKRLLKSCDDCHEAFRDK